MFPGEFAGCRVLSPIKKRCFESKKPINFWGFPVDSLTHPLPMIAMVCDLPRR